MVGVTILHMEKYLTLSYEFTLPYRSELYRPQPLGHTNLMFCFTSKPTVQHFAILIYKCKLVGVAYAFFSCGTVAAFFVFSISGDGRSARWISVAGSNKPGKMALLMASVFYA